MLEKSVIERAAERGYVDLEPWMGDGILRETLEIGGRRCEETKQ